MIKLAMIQIREFRKSDIKEVKLFADKWIGKNYFSEIELLDYYQKGKKNNIQCSFVALNSSDEIIGIRIVFAPAQWEDSFSNKISTDKWINKEAGYFKSLFIDSRYQGKGLGSQLSKKAIENLKKVGTKSIITHSWLESPNNSSQKYLLKMGFKKIINYEYYWNHLGYECTRCGNNCICTAQEMEKLI